MFEYELADLDAAKTLAASAREQAQENEAGIQRLLLAVHFADLHPSPAMIPGDQRSPGGERGIRYGGPGCPGVAEFAVAEYGVVHGVSTESAAKYIGQALALCHRLPLIWQRIKAREVTAWKARQIATACVELSMEAAALVDARVVAIVDTVGPVQLRNIVKAALWDADPEAAQAAAEQKAREHGVWVGRSDDHGTSAVYVKGRTGDVIRFDATINQIADALDALDNLDGPDSQGRPVPRQLQRARAFGVLTDPSLTHHLLQVFQYLATTQPSTTQSPADEPPAHEPSADEPPVEEQPAHKPPADAFPEDEPSVQEPPAHERPAGEPPTSERPVGEAPAHEPPADETHERPADEPPTCERPAAEPPAHEPPADEPSADLLATDSRPVDPLGADPLPTNHTGGLGAERGPSTPMPHSESARAGCSPRMEDVTTKGELVDDLFPNDEPGADADRAGARPPHNPPNHPLDPPDHSSPSHPFGAPEHSPSSHTFDPPGDSSPEDPLDPPRTDRPATRVAEEIVSRMDASARQGLAARLSAIKEFADRNSGTRPGRTKLYVHLTDETLLAGGGGMRVEGFGPVYTKLAELVGHDRIIVQPVIDLHDQINENSYEIPARLRERIKLTYPVEQFPYGPGETTNRTDIDHVVPFDPAGPKGQTSTANLRPLRRRSHRVKTFAGWKSRPVDGTATEWTTRHGFKFRVDHTGTHPIADDNPSG